MTSRLVSVGLAAPYADHHYAFRTTIKESEGSILGHVAVTTTTAVAGLIFKANYPKPKRASKSFATGTSSSFIAPSAVAGAIAAGWDIVKAKSNGRKSKTRFQTPVYVTVNGVKYAWAMTNRQLTKIKPNLKALGIIEVVGTEQDLVFGASFPKPPRVRSVASVGKGDNATSAISTTFYDPSTSKIPSDFAITSSGQYTSADWADFV